MDEKIIPAFGTTLRAVEAAVRAERQRYLADVAARPLVYLDECDREQPADRDR